MIRPVLAFNFAVEITPDGASAPLVAAAFAECDGLELSMEARTLREGGANDRVIRLAGPVSYGNLTLKRGLTRDLGLWAWVQDCLDDPARRAQAEVVLLGADGKEEVARFWVHRCLPVKLKAPALNAKDGGIAIEELQLAYERFELAQPTGAP